MAGLPLGVCAEGEKKEKSNLEFGKIQDLEMDLVTVPDSVGSGGKPAPVIDDSKATQEGRWLRIDVPFSTTNKFTPEVKFKFYLEGYRRRPRLTPQSLTIRTSMAGKKRPTPSPRRTI